MTLINFRSLISLLEAVIGEAKVCGTGQLVIIVGDLNAELSTYPCCRFSGNAIWLPG